MLGRVDHIYIPEQRYRASMRYGVQLLRLAFTVI
jgi:hypothetical protein